MIRTFVAKLSLLVCLVASTLSVTQAQVQLQLSYIDSSHAVITSLNNDQYGLNAMVAQGVAWPDTGPQFASGFGLTVDCVGLANLLDKVNADAAAAQTKFDNAYYWYHYYRRDLESENPRYTPEHLETAQIEMREASWWLTIAIEFADLVAAVFAASGCPC